MTSEIGGDLTIIDPATRQIKKIVKFEVPGLRSKSIQPVGINITKDGKFGFIDLGPANRVAVVDGATHAVLKYLLVGQRGLARRLHAGRKIFAGRQWRFQRRVGDRRRGPEGDQIDPGRRIALGRRVRPELEPGEARRNVEARDQIRRFSWPG